MAVRTQIPGTPQLDLAHSGHYTPPSHLPVTSLVTAGARHLALTRAGRIAAQQLTQRGCAGAMHGSPHRHLDSFQVESAALALVLEDKPQQCAYFPFDFPPDRLRSFFSAGVRVSSTGRARQIFSLTSSNSP